MSIKRERDFQTLFGRWLKSNVMDGLFELKISHGNTISWKCFQDQQIPSLWKAYTTGIYHKISDMSIELKPADCFFYHGPAYVVVMFNVPDNQNIFYLIHIKDVMEIKNKGFKSITKKDCDKYGIIKDLRI